VANFVSEVNVYAPPISPLVPVYASILKAISTTAELAPLNASLDNSAPIANASSIAPLDKLLALVLASILKAISIIAVPAV
jgi:uncharacterized membrane protein YqgA involved in biofilm formation